MPTTTSPILQILQDNKLSLTQPRQAILNIFIKKNIALCHSDFEKELKTIDRITIYRTLQTFLKKGIIHIVPNTQDNIQYALCRHSSIHHQHSHNHIHFTCTQCLQTTCIEESSQTIKNLSNTINNYQIQEIQVIAKGICKKCKNTPH